MKFTFVNFTYVNLHMLIALTILASENQYKAHTSLLALMTYQCKMQIVKIATYMDSSSNNRWSFKVRCCSEGGFEPFLKSAFRGKEKTWI